MTQPSKFNNLLTEAQSRRGEQEVTVAKSEPIEKATKRRAGKRNDPDYVQVTAYISKALHKKVKIALVGGEPEKEFSVLVEELLDEWIERQS
jgi:hypothetical protein